MLPIWNELKKDYFNQLKFTEINCSELEWTELYYNESEIARMINKYKIKEYPTIILKYIEDNYIELEEPYTKDNIQLELLDLIGIKL